jgi:hypothetical protein
LTPLGKSDQAITEMKKALELDPFSQTRVAVATRRAKENEALPAI